MGGVWGMVNKVHYGQCKNSEYTMNTREKDCAHSLASLPVIICAPNLSCACNAN